MDLGTGVKLGLLNHEDPRAWFLTDLEKGWIHELPEPLLYASMMGSNVVFNATLY